ncbi:Lipoprotein signal peptidase [uncultured Eubacteriales bacterium]|uniref:Lipoprotein signal peptidase n=1 Tax=uncultured Eubacteriales bacterium TaxID=172733 RepID=A0A212KIG3_9FIRM|nr:Lipoprotein signal peptidase [uncultured Eubacteriales bacterium]
MLYVLLAAALVAVDQLVKFLVRANIPVWESASFIPHVMDLTYVQNTGAAFSLFAEHTWILTVISTVVSLAILAAILKKIFPDKLGNLCLSLVLAGAVGNLIDRAAFGFVTDMFKTTFMNFAVFNVADICVVLGGIALCVYVFFFYEERGKKEPEHGDTPTDC